jgi:pimeloyl-ACP methyl ester carboxylesterase
MPAPQSPSEPEQILLRGSTGMGFGALAWGRPGEALALCLHGYPDTAWTWRHLGPRLASEGWRVVAPFMRGYGPSDLAGDGIYQIGALARDAIDLHAAAGGDGRSVLIGHDWGACAAYGAAATAPERFARVVTLAVPPAPALLRLPVALALRQLRRSWYMLFQQLPLLPEAVLPSLIPALWRAWSPGYDGSEDVARVLAALAAPGRRTAALRYYRALAQPWHRSPDYLPEQRRWARMPVQPLLYLHGRDDGCMLASLAERARSVIGPPGRVEIVEAAGHFLHLERPETVNALIAAFIAKG